MNFLLRGLKAEPKETAWQLSLFPCVVALCYYICILPSFNAIGDLAYQIGITMLLALAVTFAAVMFPGGLRACALGLNGFFILMLAWALQTQYFAQKNAGFPGGWIYTFYYDRPMTVLALAGAAFAVLVLLRFLLPRSWSSVQMRENFEHAFRLASAGFAVIYAALLFYGFYLARTGGTGYMEPNWVPFEMVRYYFIRMQEAPWEAYEDWMYLLGNMLVMFPMGFFLRGLWRRKTWISLLIPAVFSLVMELVQLVFKFGHCDIDDFILNTLGAALGVGVAWLLNALRKKMTHGEETSIWEAA